MTPTDYDDEEQRSGFNNCDDNIMLDPSMNVRLGAFHFDWFHTYLQTGIWNYEVAVCFEFFRHAPPHHGLKITLELAGEFVDRYTVPQHFRNPAGLLCSENVSTESMHFKCAASEGLSLYPLLRQFFVTVVPPGYCTAVVQSFRISLRIAQLPNHTW